jgi:predicted phage terminase large subunit-like protein
MSARNAVSSSSRAESTCLQNIAHENAAGNTVIGIDVYDIQVEDVHEFFANGVLVHNSTPEGKGDPDWTSGALVAVQSGLWWIKNIRRFRGTPKDNEDIVRQTAALDGVQTMICMEQEPGASGKSVIDHYARSVLVGYNFAGVPSHRNKLLRAGPFSSAAEAGNVRIVDGRWIGEFLDEIEAFAGDGKEHDDQVDSVTGAMAALTTDTRNLTGVSYARPDISSDRLTSADF